MVTANNPILSGFYPDPSICRVGQDFYLVNSSFAYFPGVPIFHSRDLAHWEQIGNILNREEQLPLENSEISQGIFAPTIRHHNDVFYMITTNINHGGNFIVTAQTPKGPWSVPHYLGKEAQGIDPSLFFDEDGKCYYVGTRPNPEGVRHNGDWEIWIQELSLTEMKLVGKSMAIWKGALKDAIWPEGPHIYKIGAYYYLIHAEGGTGPDHAISVARSRELWNWFEGCPRNPVFTHRNLGMNYPVVYTGHGDLVDDGNGGWYVIMLASRLCKGHSSMGRETFLAKVTWENDWPVINAETGKLESQVELPFPPCRFGKEVLEHDSFHFYGKKLDERFVSIHRCRETMYSLTERPGFLRLYTRKEKISDKADASYLGIRQKSYQFRLSAGVEFNPSKEGETAGLVLYQNHENHLLMEIAKKGNGRYFIVTTNIHGIKQMIAERELEPVGLVEINIRANVQEADIWITEGDIRTQVARNVDLLPYTTERAGGFVGCTMGMYASANGNESANYGDFAWLLYEK